jgi:hypothetical protein
MMLRALTIAAVVEGATGVALFSLGIACWPGESVGILLWPVAAAHVIFTTMLAVPTFFARHQSAAGEWWRRVAPGASPLSRPR